MWDSVLRNQQNKNNLQDCRVLYTQSSLKNIQYKATGELTFRDIGGIPVITNHIIIKQ